MTHFPVTTSFWRGVWGSYETLRRPLKRACDWALLSTADASFRAPSCTDCAAYRGHLVRMGVLR